jgi:hypothetical protein
MDKKAFIAANEAVLVDCDIIGTDGAATGVPGFSTTVFLGSPSANGLRLPDVRWIRDRDMTVDAGANWPEPQRWPLLGVVRDWLAQGPGAVIGCVLMSMDRGKILCLRRGTEDRSRYVFHYDALAHALRDANFTAPVLRLPTFRKLLGRRVSPPKLLLPALTEEVKSELERAFAEA